MPDGYPRTCRNGHLIRGPEDEHHGDHRQCWRCRRRTQAAADARQYENEESARYKAAHGLGVPGLRRYLRDRRRVLLAQREEVVKRLAEVRAQITQLEKEVYGVTEG